ncbi:MAG: hypothetical protein ACE5GE_10055 [Phycisphaerae bacterium]
MTDTTANPAANQRGVGPAGLVSVLLGVVFWMAALMLPSVYMPPRSGGSVDWSNALMGLATLVPAYIASLVGVVFATRELALRGRRAVLGYIGLALCASPSVGIMIWILGIVAAPK